LKTGECPADKSIEILERNEAQKADIENWRLSFRLQDVGERVQ
jgi:hypothetical protein